MSTYERTNAVNEAMQILTDSGMGQMTEVIRLLLNEAMKIERSKVLGAEPYERSEYRQGYANGFKEKTLKTRMGEITVHVPQTRGVEFYPSALEKGVRSERALKASIAEMYLQGVSTRRVTKVMQELCGLDVSSSQVSAATQSLDEELSKWRNRSIGEVPYLMLDAKYEKVRHGGSVISCAVLVAIGITAEGRRTLLGCSASMSEAEIHWRDFLESLQNRGLHGVRLITSDSHAGLKSALRARLTGVPWQRCQFHLQQNAGHYVPRLDMRSEVSSDIRNIFNAPNRSEADRMLDIVYKKYEKNSPKLASWLLESIPEGLTIFDFPSKHRQRIRTSNLLERINKEIKRRTAVAGIFPNEASILRLASAVLMEISEEWDLQPIYFKMNNEN